MQHVSASQIKLFQGCPRSWWLQHVQGVKPPATAAQVAGSEAHRALDAWGSGRPVPSRFSGMIEMVSRVPGVPAPGVGASELALQPTFLLSGVRVRGFIDRLFQSPKTGAWVVLDYKTKGQMTNLLEEQGLLQDAQMMVYAAAVLEARAPMSALEGVHVAHLYVPRSGGAPPVLRHAWASAEHVQEKRAELEAVVARMLEVEQTEGLEGLERGDCTAYGGCPHLSICGPVAQRPAFSSADDAWSWATGERAFDWGSVGRQHRSYGPLAQVL